MANVKTQARIDVDLSLDAQEAKDLLTHLNATTDKDSNNNVLALANALELAINGKPRAPRKSKEEKAAEKAAKEAAKAEKAAAKAAAAEKSAVSEKKNPAPAQTAPAVEKKKVTVPA